MDNLQIEPSQTKDALSSLTIRGSIMGVLPAAYAILKVFGIEIPEGLLETVVDGAMAAMAIASIFMTYIGRLRAKHTIA